MFPVDEQRQMKDKERKTERMNFVQRAKVKKLSAVVSSVEPLMMAVMRQSMEYTKVAQHIARKGI